MFNCNRKIEKSIQMAAEIIDLSSISGAWVLDPLRLVPAAYPSILRISNARFCLCRALLLEKLRINKTDSFGQAGNLFCPTSFGYGNISQNAPLLHRSDTMRGYLTMNGASEQFIQAQVSSWTFVSRRS